MPSILILLILGLATAYNISDLHSRIQEYTEQIPGDAMVDQIQIPADQWGFIGRNEAGPVFMLLNSTMYEEPGPETSGLDHIPWVFNPWTGV